MLDDHFSMRTTVQLQAVVLPLKAIGVVRFLHDITFKQGAITMLTSDPRTFQFYVTHKLPATCVNERGRHLEPGVYLTDTLIQDKFVASMFSLIKEKFRDYTHVVHIVEHEPACQHMYIFNIQYEGCDFPHWAINHVEDLKKAVARYKQVAGSMIYEAAKPENRIILPLKNSVQDPHREFILPLQHSVQEPYRQCIIHKETGKPLYFPKQVSLCMGLLMERYSDKKIADRMQLSHRTVQYYLAGARKKLNCRSNKELLSCYISQVKSIPY
jgi:hypothetical protein